MSATIVKRPRGRPKKTSSENKQKNSSTVSNEDKKQCLREKEDVFGMMSTSIVKRPPGRPRKTPGETKRKKASTTTNEVKKQCLRETEDVFWRDQYCWMCHELAQDRTCSCQRVYHNKCLASGIKKFKDGKCPECQIESVDGANLNRPFSGMLCCLLENVTKRIIAKKCKKDNVCLRWPVQRKNVKKIDLTILLEKIKSPGNGKEESYISTSRFFSDVKWIYHNCCIVYGEKSAHSQNAKELVACFKDELSEIEACPECYYHLFVKSSGDLKNVSDAANKDEDVLDVINSDFVRLCKPPHDIVWAQVPGYPCRPAKCLKVVNGVALVRFFGKFEKANLPVERVFHITEVHPENKKDKVTDPTRGRFSHKYHLAKKQLIKYCQIYKEEFRHVFPFLQGLVPYDPESVNEAIKPGDLSTIHQNLSAELQTDRNVEPRDEAMNDFQIITSTKIVATEVVAGPHKLIKIWKSKSKSNTKNVSSNISMNMTFLKDSDDPNSDQDVILPSTMLMKEGAPQDTRMSSKLGLSEDEDCNLQCKNTSQSVMDDEDDDDDDIIILDTPSTSSSKSNVKPKTAVITPSQRDADTAVDEKTITEDIPSCSLDPSLLLASILEENQTIHSLVEDGKSFLDTFILCLLSEASNSSGPSAASINKLIVETTKLKSELLSLRNEKEVFQESEKQLQKNIDKLQSNLFMEQQKGFSLESKNIDLEKRETELMKKNTKLIKNNTELMKNNTELMKKNTELENNNKYFRKLLNDFKHNSEALSSSQSGSKAEQPFPTPAPASHSSNELKYPDGKLPLVIQTHLSKSAVETEYTNAFSSKNCQKDLHGLLGDNKEIDSRCGCGNNKNKCTLHQSKENTPRWWFDAS